MSSFPVVALITSSAWSPTVQFTLKFGALPGCLASALLIPGKKSKGQRLIAAKQTIHHCPRIQRSCNLTGSIQSQFEDYVCRGRPIVKLVDWEPFEENELSRGWGFNSNPDPPPPFLSLSLRHVITCEVSEPGSPFLLFCLSSWDETKYHLPRRTGEVRPCSVHHPMGHQP